MKESGREITWTFEVDGQTTVGDVRDRLDSLIAEHLEFGEMRLIGVSLDGGDLVIEAAS